MASACWLRVLLEVSARIDGNALNKIQVFETDTSKLHLGLVDAEYTTLVRSVSAILHNAWPISAKRPIKAFEG